MSRTPTNRPAAPISQGALISRGGPPRPAARLPYDHHDPALACATWSRLAEPADQAACALVGVLGAGAALEWLLKEALDAQGQPRSAPRPPLPVAGDGARASARWAQAAARWAPRLEGLDIRREIEVLERLAGSLIIPGDPWWPPGLDELAERPFCLWLRGDPGCLSGSPGRAGIGGEGAGGAEGARGARLALVGARAATRYGEDVASGIAAELAGRGVVVVSGGAFGIDAAVHRGALCTGRTVAVSAGGVDRLYPAGNADLLRAVIDSGALVSEVPPGCQPARHRFLTRNRLIAAICRAVVVVEAAWRSGALSTAHHAQELGRPLGAVPGPVTSMASVGCHRLLRSGAVCVTDASEVLELMAPLGAVDAEADKAADPALAGEGLLDGLDPSSALVLDAMPARAAAATEALVRACGLSPRETTAALGLLELEGRVERTGQGWWRRRQRSSGTGH